MSAQTVDRRPVDRRRRGRARAGAAPCIAVLAVAIVARLRASRSMVGQHLLRPRRGASGSSSARRCRAPPSPSASCGCPARRSAVLAGLRVRRRAASPSRRCCATRSPRPTSSASARARAPPRSFGIVVLALDETAVSVLALAGALAHRRGDLPALEPRRLRRHPAHPHRHRRRGDARQRRSPTCSRSAAAWDLQTAMHWLTGSLNGATWAGRAAARRRLRGARARCCSRSGRDLDVLRLGDDTAAASASACERTRCCSSSPPSRCSPSPPPPPARSPSSRSWPGPIAARIVGPAARCCCPPALVGALLVLVADLVGQFAFDTRYPVGVITGVLGAPYLIYLLISTNRSGGSL